MDLYDKIKSISPEAKHKADSFMAELTKKYTPEHPAPPELITKGLETIIAENEKGHNPHKQSGGHSNSSNDRWYYGLKAAASIAAIAFLGTYF